MKSASKQLITGVFGGLAMVALALTISGVAGIHIGTSAAANKTNSGPRIARVSTGVSSGFSVLHSAGNAAPPSIVASLKSLHEGSYQDAKVAQSGMYLATNNGALCAWVDDAFGQCTDELNYGDVWLRGDERRMYDSESAPFVTRLYGFARDGISALRVDAGGLSRTIPIINNAFRATLPDVSFSDLGQVTKIYASGSSVKLDVSTQFGQASP